MMTIENRQNNGKPYGFWFTIFSTSFLMFLFWLIAAGGYMVIFHIEKSYYPDMDISDYFKVIRTPNPTSINVFEISRNISNPFLLVILILLIKYRKNITFQDYFAMKKIPKKKFLRWILLIEFLYINFILFELLTDVPKIDHAVANIYKYICFKPSFYFSIVLIGPIIEELLFRGFMYKGIEKTFLGSWGAVILTTIFFSACHVHRYKKVILIGFLFGFARKKTDSIYVSIIWHIFHNLIISVIAVQHVHGYI